MAIYDEHRCNQTHAETLHEEINSNLFYIMVVAFHSRAFYARERGGVVVERRTPNREVLGSIPIGVTVLCP